MAQSEPGTGRTPDPTLFEGLYAQWADPVLRYLTHLVGPGAAAEDLFQDTWEHAVSRWGQLRELDRFGPWVYRIARNLAFNYKRQFKRQGQVWIMSDLAAPGEEPSDALLNAAPDPSPGAERMAITGQRKGVLMQAIGQFDEQTQEMLQLRYFEQLTLAEVAMVLNTPLGTVCAKVHRALKTLQGTLAAQGITGLSQI